MKIIFIGLLLVSASNGYDKKYESILNLMSSTIKSAKCASKCSWLRNQEEKTKCHQVCTADAGEGLCQYSWLCGEPCRLACTEILDNRHTHRLVDIKQAGCQLKWKVDRLAGRTLTFITLAQDKAGMWRRLTNGRTEAGQSLSSAQTQMFVQLMVVAVSEQGVQDAKVVPVHSYLVCPREEEDETEDETSTLLPLTSQTLQSPDNPVVNETLFFILSLCCVFLSSVALLLFLLYHCSKKSLAQSKVQNCKLSQIQKDKNHVDIFVVDSNSNNSKFKEEKTTHS